MVENTLFRSLLFHVVANNKGHFSIIISVTAGNPHL